MKLVLASTSVYRRSLLSKLGIEFSCVKPLINEEKLHLKLQGLDLSPEKTAEVLSFEKGQGVFRTLTEESIVISGDQLVAFEGQVIGKPHTAEKAIEQLSLLNGNTHQLITAVTLLGPQINLKFNHISQLKMKMLSPRELANYVKLDLPVDCCGSYKIEKNGITLFEKIECDDFTAIQGIPMLWLSNQLKELKYEFFTV